MKKTIILSEGPYGICATPIGRWDEGISKALQKCGDFSEIEINDGKGWLGSDISFLQEFRNILSLKIIKLNLDRIDFVNHLHNLKNLELITYANAAINFQNLPQLSSFSAIWSDSYRSIFGCHWIRNLFIDGYKGKDCNEFKEMKEMESLCLLNSNIFNLYGIEEMNNLKNLRLANLKKLQSIDELSYLRNLENLHIDTCRGFDRIDSISVLTQLKN